MQEYNLDELLADEPKKSKIRLVPVGKDWKPGEISNTDIQDVSNTDSKISNTNKSTISNTDFTAVKSEKKISNTDSNVSNTDVKAGIKDVSVTDFQGEKSVSVTDVDDVSVTDNDISVTDSNVSVTDNRAQYINDYNRTHYDNIRIRLPKGVREQMKDAGLSPTALLKEALAAHGILI